VVEFTAENPSITLPVTPLTLVGRIATQLGLSSQAKANMVVRVREFRCWAYQYGPATDRVDINGEVGTTFPSVSDPVAVPTQTPVIHYGVVQKFRAFGTISEPARYGYTWPLSAQQVPIYQDSDFTLVNLVSNSGNATVHVHVLWSTAEVQPPTDTGYELIDSPWDEDNDQEQ
jgi:hypothetical protein